MGRVGLAQFRNVVGDRAAVIGGEFGVACGQEAQQRRLELAQAAWSV